MVAVRYVQLPRYSAEIAYPIPTFMTQVLRQVDERLLGVG